MTRGERREMVIAIALSGTHTLDKKVVVPQNLKRAETGKKVQSRKGRKGGKFVKEGKDQDRTPLSRRVREPTSTGPEA